MKAITNVCLSAISLCAVMANVVYAEENPPCHVYSYNNIETPCFQELDNRTMGGVQFAIREYGKDVNEFWTAAIVNSKDFQESMTEGFQKNFNYIAGGNSENKTIPMTAPVLARSNGEGSWKVSFFVPSSLFSQRSDIPSSKTISIEDGTGLKVAVIEFGGYASKEDFEKHSNLLRTTATQAGYQIVEGTNWSEEWVQYDSPFRIVGRHNEVWLKVQ